MLFWGIFDGGWEKGRSMRMLGCIYQGYWVGILGVVYNYADIFKRREVQIFWDDMVCVGRERLLWLKFLVVKV